MTTVRVRGFAYRHRLLRSWRASKSASFVEVEQVGGRAHGTRRVVAPDRLRGRT